MTVAARVAHTVGYGLVGRASLSLQRRRDERKIRSLKHGANELLAPPLESTARMKELMSRHYLEGRYANGVRKVAWVTSGAPTEALVALGYFVVYPENHAALCGARRKAEALSAVAEEAGYSRDLCSYARTDIGAALSGKTPVGKLPRPDLLLCCNNICQTVLHWYQVLQTHFNVPLVIIDTPFLYQEAQHHQVAFVKRQLEDLVTTSGGDPTGQRGGGAVVGDPAPGPYPPIAHHCFRRLHQHGAHRGPEGRGGDCPLLPEPSL